VLSLGPLTTTQGEFAMIATIKPAVRAFEAREDCEVCGNATEYGGTHCPRCRKLVERVTLGDARAILRLHELAAMAAD